MAVYDIRRTWLRRLATIVVSPLLFLFILAVTLLEPVAESFDQVWPIAKRCWRRRT
jgi:hypothetical protein